MANIYVFNNVTPAPLPTVKIKTITCEPNGESYTITVESEINTNEAAMQDWAQQMAASGRLLLIQTKEENP